jgi:hypothetical protein
MTALTANDRERLSPAPVLRPHRGREQRRFAVLTTEHAVRVIEQRLVEDALRKAFIDATLREYPEAIDGGAA